MCLSQFIQSEMKVKCKSGSTLECCPESHRDWIWMCEQGCSGFWSLSAVECRLWMSCSLPQSSHSHTGIWEWVLAALIYLLELCRKRSNRYSVNMNDLQFLCSLTQCKNPARKMTTECDVVKQTDMVA